MAEKRMFTQKIIDSDVFLYMPLSSQALYFHLNMRADDDGFVNNPKKVARMIGASEDDLKILITKRFVLTFESGVIVIKHWRMHNLIRKDRYNPTQYTEEFNRLVLKDNGAYTESGNQLATKWQPNGNQMATNWQPNGNQMATNWQPIGNQLATQNRIEENRIDKDSIDIEIEKKEYSSLLLSSSQVFELSAIFGADVVRAYIKRMEQFQNEKGKKYRNPYDTLKSWLSTDTSKPKKKCRAGNERDYSEAEMQDIEKKLLNN